MPGKVASHGAGVGPVGAMVIDPGQPLGRAAFHFQAMGDGVNGPGVFGIETYGPAA